MKEVIKIEHSDPSLGRITFVDWCLGNACNYRCSYCPERLHDASLPWHSAQTIFRFSNAIIHHYGELGQSLFFQFTGGEPTLYKDFTQVVRHLHAKGSRVGLISNGSRSLKWWEEIRDSLDGVVLTHHIEFVKLDHFLAVVKTLNPHIRVHVNVTMLPERFSECLANATTIADACANISMTLKPLLVNFGSNVYPYTGDQQAILSGSPLAITRNRAVNRVRGPMHRLFNDGSSDVVSSSQMIVNGQNHWQGWTCNIGLEMLSINAEGEIFRGVCKQGGRLGNITEEHVRFPREPVVCQKSSCHCISDLMTTRTAPSPHATYSDKELLSRPSKKGMVI